MSKQAQLIQSDCPDSALSVVVNAQADAQQTYGVGGNCSTACGGVGLITPRLTSKPQAGDQHQPPQTE